jgi:hypothetical protein
LLEYGGFVIALNQGRYFDFGKGVILRLEKTGKDRSSARSMKLYALMRLSKGVQVGRSGTYIYPVAPARST